jgi:toxin-antitoxin system PIN domain toxin
VSRALLDINVLLALLDSDHVDHLRVHDWVEDGLVDGWASCAITENGFVRIISQPRYPSPISPTQAIELLQSARESGDHDFWSCDVSLLDSQVIDRRRLHGPKQVTDSYLLALATAHEAAYVTFDRLVTLSSVPQAGDANLIVL